VSALVAAGLTVVLWSSAFVGIRSAGRSFSPGALSLGRLLVALVALGVLGYSRGERLPEKAALRTAGPAVAFAGVVVIAIASANHTATTGGVALCLAAALSYASGVVAQKVVLRTLSGTQTIFLCCAIGVAACLPFAWQLVGELGSAPAGAIGWVAYLGVAPTALGFSTWAFALRRTDAGRLAATTYLVPPLSILLGWLWLGESPAALADLGGALCLAGVAVTRSSAAGRLRLAFARSGSRS
jgi:drug/metabolite transporter (DMT)-like permease